MNIIIVHGIFGSPEENWFPWLKLNLEKHGQTVYVPRLPSDPHQGYQHWKEAFLKQVPLFDKDTILVGHSLAPVFLEHIVQESSSAVGASFFVSGFMHMIGIPEFDRVYPTFFDFTPNYTLLKKLLGQIHCYYGSDDPYVKQEYLADFAKQLGVIPTIIHGGKHLNTESGWTEFPLLLKDIIEYINTH